MASIPAAIPFAFLITFPTVKDILRTELGMTSFSQRFVPHFLSDDQKRARADAPFAMLTILQSSEANDFDGLAIGDTS
jgi:hypothetical protein